MTPTPQAAASHLLPYGPFNSDIHLPPLILRLRDQFGLKVAVETGSFGFQTTTWLTEKFDVVFTLEADRERHFHGRRLFAERVGAGFGRAAPLVPLLGPSEQLLPALAKSLTDQTLFYLDAHSCPQHTAIREELTAIHAAGLRPVIVIHDFKNPLRPDFGFDWYTDGTVLNFDLVKPYLDLIYGVDSYQHGFNLEATGARRGILWVAPKQAEGKISAESIASPVSPPSVPASAAMPVIPTYVFSWNGVDEKNTALMAALRQPWSRVIVVASEDGESVPERLRIGRDAHYGEQFAAAVAHYRQSGLTCGCVMIVGDMMPRCNAHAVALNGWHARQTVFPRDAHPFLYAPYVHGPWPVLRHGNVRPPMWGSVAPALLVDCSCWYLNHKAMDIAAQLPPLHFGYGVDMVLCGAIRHQGGAVTLDYGCQMVNPPSKGYAHDAATAERTAWFAKVRELGLEWHNEFGIQ